MTRDLSASMQTAVQQPVIRPRRIVRIDIAGDPITVWEGPGIYAPSGTSDAALNGQVFDPISMVLEYSDISEGGGIGGPLSISMAMGDIDDEPIRQVIRDRRVWQGRKAWVWWALLSADESTVITTPMRAKTGVVTRIATTRGSGSFTASLVIDSDIARAKSAPFRWTDHPRIHTDDDGSRYIHKLANKPRGINGNSGSNVQTPAPSPGMREPYGRWSQF